MGYIDGLALLSVAFGPVGYMFAVATLLMPLGNGQAFRLTPVQPQVFQELLDHLADASVVNVGIIETGHAILDDLLWV